VRRVGGTVSTISPPAPAGAGALDAQQLLGLPPARLDALFRESPAGEIPRGRGSGTAILFPATEVARPIAAVIRAVAWKGKQFEPATQDLKNLMGPTGIPAIRAEVSAGTSWHDEQPCVLLDYSRSSRVAGWIRDEIREVAPGLYLGLVWGVGRVFGGRRVIGRFALTFAD
jgi:hypothetical protein